MTMKRAVPAYLLPVTPIPPFQVDAAILVVVAVTVVREVEGADGKGWHPPHIATIAFTPCAPRA